VFYSQSCLRIYFLVEDLIVRPDCGLFFSAD